MNIRGIYTQMKGLLEGSPILSRWLWAYSCQAFPEKESYGGGCLCLLPKKSWWHQPNNLYTWSVVRLAPLQRNEEGQWWGRPMSKLFPSDGDSKCGFSRMGAWPTILIWPALSCAGWCSHNLSWLDLHLVWEKSKFVELVKFEHGDCIYGPVSRICLIKVSLKSSRVSFIYYKSWKDGNLI